MPNDTAVSAPSPILQLGYCTNVHAGADLLATRANLEKYALAVKRQVNPNCPMGVGLWLSAEAVGELLEQELIETFSEWLDEVGLEPFTLNGFPYGDFHRDVVKHEVYQPDWTNPDRLRYTDRLIEIHDRLLAPGAEGSISTLPLAWNHPPLDSQKLGMCAANLRLVAHRLERLEQDRGRLIYLCLEPEPGCALQRSTDVVQFFQDHLLVAGDEDRLRRYIRVCHDVCHAAVMFEDQSEVLQRYRAAGILVGKVQVSSAIVLRLSDIAPDARAAAIEQLSGFTEDRYLHQTMVQRSESEAPEFYEDLPLALDKQRQSAASGGQWRVHYHVPIYLDRFGALETSQADIVRCLAAVRHDCSVKHFEVETYGWELLPRNLQRTGLADGIAEEIHWLREQI
ncbi:MAG: metabolite traffic protein EboE [Pirellulaceae bacterium]|nr:metabolite traffic protein EboE [Pirellulaceae bacterium]